MKIKRKINRKLVLNIRCASGNDCDVYAGQISDEQRIIGGQRIFPVSVQWKTYPPTDKDLAEAEPQIIAWQEAQVRAAGMICVGGTSVMAPGMDTDDVVNSFVNSTNSGNN